MDEQGFRAYLAGRKVEPEAIDRSVEAVRRFERHLESLAIPDGADRAGERDVHRHAAALVREGDNSEETMIALARYARFAGDREAWVAWLELFDGWDVPVRLSGRLAELAGPEVRDAVFGGMEIPPLGTPAGEKPPFTAALMERLGALVDQETCRQALTGNLHYVPSEAFTEERKRYLAAPNIDAFISDEHERYVGYLAGLRDSGEMYFSQPITDAVVEYVRDTPTCGPGIREGAIVRETKIPYQADAYLRDEDESMTRYHACHCMWARESLLHPEGSVCVSPLLCQCSAGFTKQYWDAVLGQPVQVDVVRSVLQGDLVCEFAIHLPEEVVDASD
jgi:hypothetical protein